MPAEPADDDPPEPPPTLEYRSGTDDARTDWRDGFSLMGRIVDNVLGVLIGACGLMFAAADLSLIVNVIISLVHRFDWFTVAAGAVGASLLSMGAGFLLYLASQFITLRPRR